MKAGAATLAVDSLDLYGLFNGLTKGSCVASKADGSIRYDLLIFGVETIYLSLLPRFSPSEIKTPHSYQLLLEASLTASDKATGSQQSISMKNLDKLAGPDNRTQRGYFTFNTEWFDVEKLFFNQAPSKHPIKLSGTILRRHVEKGGKPLLENVVASVTRSLYACRLDGGTALCLPKAFEEPAKHAPRPRKNGPLEYLLFGTENNLFMVHKLTNPPDFDQVLYVGTFGDIPSFTVRQALRDGGLIKFPRKTNIVRQRLRVGQREYGEARFGKLLLDQFRETSDALNWVVIPEKEIYFEEGELRMPPEFATTPLEKEAGFP